MSFVLEFLAEARDEAKAAVKFYEDRVPGLGVRLREKKGVDHNLLTGDLPD